MSRRILNLLMSRQAIESHGQDIVAALGDVGVNWLSLESAPNEQGVYATDIAFISRDITGASTKTHVLRDLARCYEILRASPQLQWVHAHSAGADRPIYAELRARGVRVSTSAGANAAPVAHTAVGAVLALGRQFPLQMAAQLKREYTPMTNHPDLHDLTGQTAMVVGLGAIGSRIARYLDVLGLKVIGVTREPADHINLDVTRAEGGELGHCQTICSYAHMRRHLSRVNYLVLACPLTPLTKALVNAELLSQLPKGSYLVNVARGEVCVEADVIAALQSAHLCGAFLDGFEHEPLSPESPLWAMRNVMISAHTAGHFTGYAEQVMKLFIDNLRRYVQGQTLQNELS
jgi:phosphoglycerate dehydrogenase-like enzyme